LLSTAGVILRNVYYFIYTYRYFSSYKCLLVFFYRYSTHPHIIYFNILKKMSMIVWKLNQNGYQHYILLLLLALQPGDALAKYFICQMKNVYDSLKVKSEWVPTLYSITITSSPTRRCSCKIFYLSDEKCMCE